MLNRLITGFKKQPYVWVTLLVFGLIYIDISFINHYLFRTTAWDMGIFNNALYSYAHLHYNYAMVRIPMSPVAVNLLGDHLELYPILFAPFYYMFGTYTLLLFQVLFLLWGGYGTYKFILHKTGNPLLSRMALVHFFCIWGIYTALAFDYHNNVVAAMGIPWFLLYFDKNKWLKASVVFLFIMLGKENMPLWMGFIGLALLAWHFRDRQKAIAGGLFAFAGFAFFILTIKVIIPAFAPAGQGYAYNSFHALGNDFGEVLKTAITRPWYTFTLLYKNHLGVEGADGVKIMLHIAVLLSGGWALLYRPKYLLMLLPVYGQKLFYDDPTRWGVYCHYSIEFVPLITIALFLTLPALFRVRKSWLLASGLVSIILTAWMSMYILNKKEYHSKATHRFYTLAHYERDFNAFEAHGALKKLVPDTVSVSAQSNLIPHLSFRDTIYQFPAGGWCDYIVLAAGNNPFGISEDQMDSLRRMYAANPNREIIYDKNSMLIIRKKN